MDICVSPHARRYKSIIRFKTRTLINSISHISFISVKKYPCLYTVICTTCRLYLQKSYFGILAFIRIAQVCNLKILQNIYFAYIHSQLIFWYWSLWCYNSQRFGKNFVSSKEPFQMYYVLNGKSQQIQNILKYWGLWLFMVYMLQTDITYVKQNCWGCVWILLRVEINYEC